MMSKPKWEKFEELVTEVQRKLSPESQVRHNDKIKGKTGALRQVDVSIRDTIGQFHILIAIDCKDQKDPVDLPDVETWIGLVQDIGANKGAIVSASGFTGSARNRSQDAGISLYRLVDVGEHEWKTLVSIPVLCDFRRIQNYRFTFKTDQKYVFIVNEVIQAEVDHRNISLYDANNNLIGKIFDFLVSKWERRLTPVTEGDHDVCFQNDRMYLKHDNSFLEVIVGVRYSVKSELRLGFVPLEQFSGLQDVVTGGVITDGFTTSGINIEDVKDKWQVIDCVDQLAIRPVITLTSLQSIL